MPFALPLLAALVLAPATAPSDPSADVFESFPVLDQLHQPTADGKPDENAGMNCVPTSIAAGLEFLTGTKLSPDEIKDGVYGDGYVGPTKPERYVEFIRKYNVVMRPVQAATPAALVATLRALLEKGIPCIITMPGQVNALPKDLMHPNQVTHVAIAAGFGPQGTIRVMNPWGGYWQEGDDAYWAARLCYGEIWAMEKVESA